MTINHADYVPQPTVGLLILGRKRPGFDPEWGAAVQARIKAFAGDLSWSVHIPSDNITDDRELQHALEQCRARGVTTLVLVQPTISDGRLAPLLSRLWRGPLVLWATPEKPTGAKISANSLVGTHVMAATLRQLGHPLEFVYGDPDDPQTRDRVRRAILATHAADSITGRSLGLIGYHAPGFVDFHADPVFLNDKLNSQLFHMSTSELIALVEGVTDEQVTTTRQKLADLGLPAGAGITGDGTAELTMQARYYQAFRSLFTENSFAALAFRCWPDLPTVTGHWPYLALALLVSEGYPITMEGDVDGAICARIAESLGIGPVYLTDWLEHTTRTVSIWHTGAAPFQLCEPPGTPTGPRLGVQFNNQRPTVVEASIKAGMEVTLFRLWRYDGGYWMTALEGHTVQPTRPLMATNGLFETDQVDVYDWFEERVQIGMPHHLCVVRGHHRETLYRVARLIGADTA